MYREYVQLLQLIRAYHAMIFTSQFSTCAAYTMTVGIKNGFCTVYIQKFSGFPYYTVTVKYNDGNSQVYDLDLSELADFLDVHLLRKEERQVA